MSITLGVLDEYRDAINKALDETFREFPERLGVELSEPAQIALGRLRDYSTRGGKRVRGSLAAATYDEAAGTRLGKPGVRLGVALELMQNYLLVIDDVMDKSALRRGKPTVHELYLAQTNPKVDLHEAQMMAVNTGQLAQHMASLVVADIPAPDAALRQVMQLLHTNIVTTGIGQIDDIYQQIGREVSETDIMRKYECKSSYYTFINPMQCGFALAGKGTASNLDWCKEFGLPAGVAFQLHDDYLGIFADPKALGKPNLDDIREGKYTLLVHYALQNSTVADADALRSILSNDAADEADLARVQEVLDRSGAAVYVQEAAARAARQAKSVLKESGWDTGFVELLDDLVEFSITRES